MTSMRPSLAANHNAVTSDEAASSTSAPLSKRNSTIFVWPIILASINAVMPSLSLALTSMPFSTRSLQISRCPEEAAGIKAVKSSQSRTFTSIPSLSIASTVFKSPSLAAPIIRAPSEANVLMSAFEANCNCKGVYRCSVESHGAVIALLVSGSRNKQVLPFPSERTYPVSASPRIFQFLAPQWEHLAILASISLATSPSLHDFSATQSPSSCSSTTPSAGRL
mmetsp:Transcript_34454/g.97895  ORF Transcript_34454/g.97895 Transcript_34454/m.97895 type:complete len:223 (-) Transcript_34454:316-984(-)